MYIIVGALGKQAKAIIHKLVQLDPQCEISAVDHQIIPHPLSNGFKQPNVVGLFNEISEIPKSSMQNSVVISCASTQHNASIAFHAAKGGASYIDLGGELEHTHEVLDAWNTNYSGTGICMPDVGVAPGYVSSLLGHYIKEGAENIKVFCGGIPKHPNKLEPHRYGRTFSSEGLIKEYTGVCTAIEKGKIRYYAALDGLEEVYIDGLGYLEAVHMSGSLSKTPELLQTSKKQSYCYKTLRWPGHWKWAKENLLIHPNSVEVAEKVLPAIKDDYLIVVASVDGQVEFQRIWEYDPETDLTGMQQATGFTVAAVAHMIDNESLNKDFVFEKDGIHWMHDVHFDRLNSFI